MVTSKLEFLRKKKVFLQTAAGEITTVNTKFENCTNEKRKRKRSKGKFQKGNSRHIPNKQRTD